MASSATHHGERKMDDTIKVRSTSISLADGARPSGIELIGDIFLGDAFLSVL